ncbi:pseudouridine synthase [Xanthomonas translucens]|nr:pseudouridine synthase [Xanthomonas translucens]MCS3359724.1 pseudouridine synthase [Xanthomonas translucens pv. translucens]MCS3373566.1 pseudouridine synthase [Xanthomonas translucens pv. translucens]MCT8273828.1 pseudouridine synthase [Xanthomonas translucens pv. translucens]MCT8277734.1 pseudouridine synthase [Xanthomonas translucens pv. translucens]MCT8289228.1 pseudouridine synthase [Xanthomonas translucens pv. translucens]
MGRCVTGALWPGRPGADNPAVRMSPDSLQILYLDPFLAVVDKPAGLMVHDSKLARGEDDFLADRLRAQLGRPIFLVHRLDRATSGCLLLAFDRDTASALGKALMAGEVDKDYLAICRGWPAEERFDIDHDLDGGPGKPLKKPAQTRFQRLACGELPVPSGEFGTSRYALLRCSPVTGRFRQIRRHLKHLSHHLIGDTSHGDGRHNRIFRMQGVQRMLLHAERLAFPHPDGRRIEVNALLDAQFVRAFGLFGWSAAPWVRGEAERLADAPGEVPG